MTGVLLLALTLLPQSVPPTAFGTRADLQGLYDEMSQATLQFETESDVDMFHDVLCTPDWVFVDATGHTQTWPQARQRAIQALSAPRLDWIAQPIKKVSLASDGVTVIVNMITVHAIVDHEGRYGRPDASHTLTETTAFRDQWVRVSDEWKLKSRQQISGPTVAVDKIDREEKG